MPAKRKNVNEVTTKDSSEWSVEHAIDEVTKTILEESTNEPEHPLGQSMYVSEVSDHASDIATKEENESEVSSSDSDASGEYVEEEGESESEEEEESEEDEEIELDGDSDECAHKYVYIVERRNNENGLPGIITCVATLLISLWTIRGLILISSFLNDKLCCKCF
jgi:hypothetical protein